MKAGIKERRKWRREWREGVKKVGMNVGRGKWLGMREE